MSYTQYEQQMKKVLVNTAVRAIVVLVDKPVPMGDHDS